MKDENSANQIRAENFVKRLSGYKAQGEGASKEELVRRTRAAIDTMAASGRVRDASRLHQRASERFHTGMGRMSRRPRIPNKPS